MTRAQGAMPGTAAETKPPRQTRITSITPEQAAKFGEWSKKWIEIGLSTESADFDLATDAALRAYAACNLKRPMVILRMSSPYAATVGGAMVWAMLREVPRVRSQVESQVGSQVGSQVESQVGSQVGSQVESQVESQVGSQVESQVESQVWSQVRSQVESQVWSQVGSQVWSQVWSQVRSQVGSQVWSQVRSQVGSQVESQVRSQVGSQVESQVGSQVESQVWSQVESQVWSQVRSGVNNDRGGAFWASWSAYVSFLRDVLGWENPSLDMFKIDEDLVKSCGWVWWHENVLAISDRPIEIHRDGEGRLHSLVGPSISYRDGWSLYHSHGTAIPAAWVEDSISLTPKVALTWENVEQRRAACEILGWSRILDELSARTIDTDTDPQIGQLVEVDIPEIGRERFLRVRCGTGRQFALPVPPDMKSALQAQAWTWGLSELDFVRPEVRT